MTRPIHYLASLALMTLSSNARAMSFTPANQPSVTYDVSISLTKDIGDRLFYTATDVVTGRVFSSEQDSNVLVLPVGTYVIKGESNFCFTEQKTAYIDANSQLELLVGCE